MDVPQFMNLVQVKSQLDQDFGNGLLVEETDLLHLVLKGVVELGHDDNIEPGISYDFVAVDVSGILVQLILINCTGCSCVSYLSLDIHLVIELDCISEYWFNFYDFIWIVCAQMNCTKATSC